MSFLMCCSSRAPPGRLLEEEAAAAVLRDECGPFPSDSPFDEFTALSFYREENKGPAVLLSVSRFTFQNNILKRSIVQVKGPVQMGPVYPVDWS